MLSRNFLERFYKMSLGVFMSVFHRVRFSTFTSIYTVQ